MHVFRLSSWLPSARWLSNRRSRKQRRGHKNQRLRCSNLNLTHTSWCFDLNSCSQTDPRSDLPVAAIILSIFRVRVMDGISCYLLFYMLFLLCYGTNATRIRFAVFVSYSTLNLTLVFRVQSAPPNLFVQNNAFTSKQSYISSKTDIWKCAFFYKSSFCI